MKRPATYLEILGHTQARRMRNNRGIRFPFKSEMPAGRCAEAVSSRADPSNSLGFQSGDDTIDDGDPAVWAMLRKPCVAVKLRPGSVVFRESLSLEEIWHDGAIAVSCKVINKQLKRKCKSVESHARKYVTTDLVVDERDSKDI